MEPPEPPTEVPLDTPMSPEDPELDDLANLFIEELEEKIAEDVEKLQEAVDKILE